MIASRVARPRRTLSTIWSAVAVHTNGCGLVSGIASPRVNGADTQRVPGDQLHHRLQRTGPAMSERAVSRVGARAGVVISRRSGNPIELFQAASR